jgi:hypothetical protein
MLYQLSYMGQSQSGLLLCGSDLHTSLLSNQHRGKGEKKFPEKYEAKNLLPIKRGNQHRRMLIPNITSF